MKIIVKTEKTLKMARVDYYQYLCSREWALKRKAVKERAGGICERCKRAPLRDTHHLSYRNLGNEPLEDLMGVCRPCHEFLSGKADWDPKGLCRSCDAPLSARRGERGYCPSCEERRNEIKARFKPGIKAILEEGEPFIPDWCQRFLKEKKC
jgi:hypothetical protein